MRTRTLVAVTVLAAALGGTAPASAEPVEVRSEPSDGRFSKLDLGGLDRVRHLPRSARRDATVSALVELTPAPEAEAEGAKNKAAARQAVRSSQAAAVPRLRAAGATVQGRMGTVLNAVRVRAKVSDLDEIADISGVKSVQVSRIVRPDNARANRFTGVDAAWDDLGYTGTGQKIAVIDSGIDYTHADFGGPGTVAAFTGNNGTVIEPNSFPTAKVVGGTDLVGDTYDASSDDVAVATPDPDPDPLDCAVADGGGHGTHVAGTAAGQGVTSTGATFTGPYDGDTLDATFEVAPGSAPEASLLAFRVFGCEGSSADAVIVEAIDRAVQAGADVINMSLGSALGTADDLTTAAVDNATKAGTLVVASAGNEGPGAYITGTPASADTAISVAAVDGGYATFPGVRVTGAATGTVLNANDAAFPAGGITGELVNVELGCEPSDYAGVAGNIAVSTRGVCDRVLRAELGQAAGALAVIMVNNAPGLPPFEGPIDGVTIPFVGVGPVFGERLLGLEGQQVTLADGPDIANPGYTEPAGFTSNGPRRLDDAQKPDVAAPGVSLLSAASGAGTGGAFESGTSMSAPHVAGIAALVAQSQPSWPPLRIKSAITSTARPDKVGDYDSRRVGTGLVQPRRATDLKAWISADSGRNALRFGMHELTGGYSETQKFTIYNGGTSSITYDLVSAVSSPSALGADLTVSPSAVTVPAGGSRSVSLTIRLTSTDVARLPGAAASDGGLLTTLNGYVRALPRSAAAGVYALRIAFMSVPVATSDIRPNTLDLDESPTSGNLYGSVQLRNRGIHAGGAELYAWLATDASGDAVDPEVPDLVDLGVQTLPATLVDPDADPADKLMVFVANAAGGTSTQSSREVDLAIDTNGDGTVDYYVFAADLGLVLTGVPDGSMGSFVLPAGSEEVTAAYTAPAPANGSQIQLPVLASDLQLTAASGPIAVSAAGFTIVGEEALDGDEMATASFDPFRMVVTSGRFTELAPGATGSFRLAVYPSRRAGQTTQGWLVVTPDDRAGLAEANRVRLP